MTCYKRIQMRSESRASRPIILCVFYDGALVYLAFFGMERSFSLVCAFNANDPAPFKFSFSVASLMS